MANVLVIGSLNIDLVVRSSRIPEDGESIQGMSFQQFPGGKGANQAVAAARLGASTYMVGCIGDDAYGELQRTSLTKDGISIEQIHRDTQESTGVAFILLDEQGNNRIVAVPGANDRVTAEHVDQAFADIADVDVLLVQLEIPIPVVIHAIEVAQRRGIKVVLNPAPAPSTPLPESVYSSVDVITPNESETQALTGILPSSEETTRQAALALQEKGVSQVIITLGSKGVYGLDGTDEFFIPSHQVDVVDTVAAGDGFSGALAVGLGEHKSLYEAAKIANAVAALAVTKHGAQPSLPSRAEVDGFLG